MSRRITHLRGTVLRFKIKAIQQSNILIFSQKCDCSFQSTVYCNSVFRILMLCHERRPDH